MNKESMKFYHGTNKYGWGKTKRQGFLLHERANKMFPSMSPCTYLAIDKNEAEQYGDVILEVEYNPLENPEKNNYHKDCWQVRVYEPILLENIKLIKSNKMNKGLENIIGEILEKYYKPTTQEEEEDFVACGLELSEAVEKYYFNKYNEPKN